MKNRARKSIPYPANWGAPKYHLGQLTKEGPIVGIEYLGSEYGLYKASGEGWGYWIIMKAGDIQKFPEDYIELLDQAEIQQMIEARAAEIEILKEQLNLIA
ncbi:MAG: hypothetical protein KME29_31595 [Calothrix sp. FI2-JRJ7]|jgi:hypothetical protein|nr:hypothetical protein [Calothrix sp. FI2-JRJ7]